MNPNNPWKTRGNGAIALRFGHGAGTPHNVGWVDGRPIRSFPRPRGAADPEALRPLVEQLVEPWPEFDDPTTNPAFSILRRPPSPCFYSKAVRAVVSVTEARHAAQGLGL